MHGSSLSLGASKDRERNGHRPLATLCRQTRRHLGSWVWSVQVHSSPARLFVSARHDEGPEIGTTGPGISANRTSLPWPKVSR